MPQSRIERHLVPWPTPQAVQQGHLSLSRYAEQLVSSSAALVNQLAAQRWSPVAVVSPDPSDFLLARLLGCFGCRVTFYSPTHPVWEPAFHTPLVDWLINLFAQRYPHLNGLELRGWNQQNFQNVEGFRWQRWPTTAREQFGVVIARQMLPLTWNHTHQKLHSMPTQDSALSQMIQALGELCWPGGAVHFITALPIEKNSKQTSANETQAQAVAYFETIFRSACLWQIGLNASVDELLATVTHIQSLSSQEATPLALHWEGIKLSEPILEYPRGSLDSIHLMAHCQARLDFAAQFVRDQEVLEAGCGMGIGAALFRRCGARRVLGLDYNADAIANAQIEDPAIELKHWDLEQTPLPLADESFDLIVCLEVLEHIRHQRDLIAEFYRILRPGGRLILSVPNARFEREWSELNQFVNTYHLHVPTLAEFRELLEPFADLQLARQIDFTGSIMILDEAPLEGRFLSYRQFDRPREPAEVYAAVCSKPTTTANALTQTSEAIGPQLSASTLPPAWERGLPTLTLFTNQLQQQLQFQRGYRDLHHLSYQYRQALWEQENLSRAKLEQLPTPAPATAPGAFDYRRGAPLHADTVALWYHSGGVCYSSKPLAKDSWLERLAIYLEPCREVDPPLPVGQDRPCWELTPDGDHGWLRLQPAVPPQVHTVLFPVPKAAILPRTLWYWRQRQAVEAWFCEPTGWQVCSVEALIGHWLYERLLAWTPGFLRRRLQLDQKQHFWRVEQMAQKLRRQPATPAITYPLLAVPAAQQWEQWLAADNQAQQELNDFDLPDGPIIHYIGGLYAGGAERQLCNLVTRLHEWQQQVAVWTTYPLEGQRAHYAHLLHQHQVPTRAVQGKAQHYQQVSRIRWDLLRIVPEELIPLVTALAWDLAATRPAVLHCWLDHPNVVGGIAGLMAGVPRIVLSTRNSNPTNFPRLNTPFFQKWYQLLARSQRVQWIANSHSGAASYAEWVDLPIERFHVILNGVRLDHFPEPTPANREALRRKFDIPLDAPVIGGAFRLDPEKQPLLFLDVVDRVRQRIPKLRVLLAGTGTLEEEVHQEIRRRGLESVIHLLGRTQYVGEVLIASDVMLLTSTLEGCPNIVLEAQYLGVPVVATAGGGTTDAVWEGQTGLLAGVSDAAGLSHNLIRILWDDRLREKMQQQGRPFVERCFDLDQMVQLTQAVYENAFLPTWQQKRIVTPHPQAHISDLDSVERDAA